MCISMTGLRTGQNINRMHRCVFSSWSALVEQNKHICYLQANGYILFLTESTFFRLNDWKSLKIRLDNISKNQQDASYCNLPLSIGIELRYQSETQYN